MVLTPLCGAKIKNLFDKSKYFCIFFPKITKIGYLALYLLYGKFISGVGKAKVLLDVCCRFFRIAACFRDCTICLELAWDRVLFAPEIHWP